MTIDIYYCYRWWRDTSTYLDTVQLWLDSVVALDDPTDSACFDTLLPADLIYFADSFEYANFTQENSLPDLLYCWCSDGCNSTIMEGYLPQCWFQKTAAEDRAGHQKAANTLTGGGLRKTFSGCSPDSYCITTCKLCFSDPTTYTPSLPVYSDCSTVSVGDPTCLRAPPPPHAQWIDGSCYSISCIFTAPGVIEPMGVLTPAVIDEGLTLYPNPSAKSLTIRSAQLGEVISVLDVLGREVLHGVIASNGQLLLDVSSLASGTYYINGGHKEVKFIKK